MKNLNLAEECGVTVNSLENAKIFVKAYGIPEKITLTGDPSEADYVVNCEWGRLFSLITFDFTGFSWGYGGEGPRGLYTFLHDICKATEVKMETIINLELKPRESRIVYSKLSINHTNLQKEKKI